MKNSIMQPHNITQDLMSYLGSAGKSQQPDGAKLTPRATDSFGEMFNSLMNSRESIHSRDSIHDPRQRETMGDLQKESTDRAPELKSTEDTLNSREDRKIHTSGKESNEVSTTNQETKGISEKSAPKNGKEETTSKSIEKEIKKNDARKSEDKDATDITELQEKLSSLITLLQNLKEESGDSTHAAKLKKELQALIGKLNVDIDSLDTKKMSQQDMKRLMSLKQLLQTMDKELSGPEGAIDTKKAMALLDELKKQMPLKETKDTAHSHLAASTQQKTDQLQESRSSDVKDSVLTVETEKNEASQGKSGDSNSFSFKDQDMSSSIHKNFSRISAQEKPSSLFREQVNELINRSRMVMQDRQNGSITLKMYPERLGNVSVHLGLDNGTLTGNFLVESQEAKDLLLANMEQLRERLEEEGISFGNFHVNVRDEHNFAGKQQAEGDDEDEMPSPYQLENATQEYSYSGNYSHSGSVNLII